MVTRKKSVSRIRSGGRLKPSRTMFGKPKSAELAKIVSIESRPKARESIEELLEKHGEAAHDKRIHIQRAMTQAANRARAFLKKKNLSAQERDEMSDVANIFDAGAMAARIMEALRNEAGKISPYYSWFNLNKIRADEDKIEMRYTVTVNPPMYDSDDESDYDEDGMEYVDHDSVVDEMAVEVAKLASEISYEPLEPDDIQTNYDYDRYTGHMEVYMEIPLNQDLERRYPSPW